jgi:hypothetical protein
MTSGGSQRLGENDPHSPCQHRQSQRLHLLLASYLAFDVTTECTAADAAVAAASAKLSNFQSFEPADLKAIVKISQEGQDNE